jgi:hypothetical protein
MDTLERFSPELFVANYNPPYPLAGDTKGAAYSMTPEEALKHQFIQSNAKGSPNLLVVDIDDCESTLWLKHLVYDKELIPEPNWTTTNPHKGSSHAVWVIDGGAGTTKGRDFMEDMRVGLTDLAGGDPDYIGLKGKMRNPLHSGQVTEWGTDHIYTLKEIKTFLTKAQPKGRPKAKRPTNTVGSRHLELFDQLRQWAYYEWKNPNFQTRIMLEAMRINSEFSTPLHSSSLVTVTRSIEGFIKREFSLEKWKKIQSYRGKKSGEVRGIPAAEKRAAILAHLEAGFSVREIQEALGIKSLDAARQAVHRAKTYVPQPNKDN